MKTPSFLSSISLPNRDRKGAGPQTFREEETVEDVDKVILKTAGRRYSALPAEQQISLHADIRRAVQSIRAAHPEPAQSKQSRSSAACAAPVREANRATRKAPSAPPKAK